MVSSKPDIERRFWWNSRIIYHPKLDPVCLPSAFGDLKNFVSAVDNNNAVLQTVPGKNSELIILVTLPYVISDATMTINAFSSTPSNLSVSIKPGNHEWRNLNTFSLSGDSTLSFDLSPGLLLKDDCPIYHYQVKIKVPGGASSTPVVLTDITVMTNFLANPLLFPSLQSGINQIVYEDESPESNELNAVIEHRWQENEAYLPLPPVSHPIQPENKSCVQESLVKFHWPVVDGAHAYHLLVTRKPNTEIPYRPAYDVIIEDHEYCVPFTQGNRMKLCKNINIINT